MSGPIPLIRSAAIAPMRRWLIEQGHDPRDFLKRAGLAWIPDEAPTMPIPLVGATRLLVEIARAEGPDAPHRIVDGRGAFEIGLIGNEAFLGQNVRDALHRISRAMPRHSTHEIFTVLDRDSDMLVKDGWIARLGDDETQHVVQQYVAALVDMICTVTGAAPPCVSGVAVVPHPVTGLSHLRSWLGDRVRSSDDRTLTVEIRNEMADLPIPSRIRDEARRNLGKVVDPIQSGQTLADGIAVLAGCMMPSARPTTSALAEAVGLSSRTLQRRLSEEGTNAADIVDRVRARTALERLHSVPPPKLEALAAELGFTNPATLTRAMRRWTGKTPSEFKSNIRFSSIKI